MPIPGDPLNRWWLEAEATDDTPDHRHLFGACVVAFMASNHHSQQELSGTGFLIAGTPAFAVGITAKHVLSEGVLNIQRPRQRYAQSALQEFLPPSARAPNFEPERVMALWLGTNNQTALNVAYCTYEEESDLSCYILRPQETETTFLPVSVPLDTTTPNVGDVVHMVSQNGLNITNEQIDPRFAEGSFKITVGRRLTLRCGVVTGVFPQGYRQYRWPCFTTSMPAEPGMSGGFVYIPRDGVPISACGIVCADNSSDEARASFLDSGESVIGCAWSALGLRIPPSFPVTSYVTLYEMMRSNRLPMAFGGIDHLELIELENNGYRLQQR